ncbi:MAG TPA: hypothetical protein VHO66_00900 [Ruminiclostridium sp.]|nr:hypothetical protein [Ruminiclostridium sp.]
MDTFIEHIIKQKNSPIKNIQKISVIIGVVILEIFCVILMMAFANYSFIFLVLMAGIIYGAWYLLKFFSLEFEYIVTNGEMDVDKVIAKSKRKRVTTINFRTIEIMAPLNGNHKNEFENKQNIKTINASVSPDEEDTYFIITRTEKLGYFRMIFNPDERIIKSAQAFAPRMVFTD